MEHSPQPLRHPPLIPLRVRKFYRNVVGNHGQHLSLVAAKCASKETVVVLLENIFGFIEQQNRTLLPGGKDLTQGQALQPLLAAGFLSLIIRIRNQKADAAGAADDLARELGLAGARLAIQKHIDARGVAVEGVNQQALEQFLLPGKMRPRQRNPVLRPFYLRQDCL